jgi:hypothetical protein
MHQFSPQVSQVTSPETFQNHSYEASKSLQVNKIDNFLTETMQTAISDHHMALPNRCMDDEVGVWLDTNCHTSQGRTYQECNQARPLQLALLLMDEERTSPA